MLVTATNALVRVLLAPVCAACGDVLDRPLDGPVCAACWRAVPRARAALVRALRRCAAVRRSRARGARAAGGGRRPFDVARSAGRYDGSLRRIIHAFKYERPPAAGGAAGRADARGRRRPAGWRRRGRPVPLHPWRALRRGFNQADDLARHSACRSGGSFAGVGTARRRPACRPRSATPTCARPSRCRWRHAWLGGPDSRLRDRVVVLVDDVMTTGATLDACARVLLDAGVRSVRALTAARAVAAPPHPPPPPRHPSASPRR